MHCAYQDMPELNDGLSIYGSPTALANREPRMNVRSAAVGALVR